jgi:hypothetical protein
MIKISDKTIRIKIISVVGSLGEKSKIPKIVNNGKIMMINRMINNTIATYVLNTIFLIM